MSINQRGHLLTEQRYAGSTDLDQHSLAEILQIINQADQQVPLVVAEAIPAITTAAELIFNQLVQRHHLFYLGAGTSGRLGVLDAAECPPTFSADPQQVQGVLAGGERALVQAVEGAEDDRDQAVRDLQKRGFQTGDVLCGIAAGSTTPYVLAGLEYAHDLGSPTIFITCNPEGAQLITVDQVIVLPVGPEILTGSTRMKAGTATKLVLNMLSTSVMVKLGKVYGNLMVDLRATNSKLWERGTRFVQYLTGLESEAARKLLTTAQGQVKTAVVMHHRGVDFATAQQLLQQAEGHLRRVIGNVAIN
ncbi:N-acetylmuramic acid 6-phosphate etherase [Gloeomargarita lithophora Alchichica-D10]|uniref:N-acetylmuramic acid 6-phosphate etherase n=1 Tax=Gloeomargarita lithophora Alchichica-D10 TaxID=1188229 RepID=A0A1J0AGJ5_9CYAN|nr:N-acetylmuramic acid 6-phosphate etherase [Gloeomargarita lithophora]APB35068.1 N-acetylmuramic acid 6-phosphate etherase [Gloeomargarita lithophora Alchichica-D10]